MFLIVLLLVTVIEILSDKSVTSKSGRKSKKEAC